jgi:hypothetical protein
MTKKNTSLAAVTGRAGLTLSDGWRTRKRRRTRGKPLATTVSPAPLPLDEEVLVIDARAGIRPAQVVENKLTRLLQQASVPVSHLQMRGLLKIR